MIHQSRGGDGEIFRKYTSNSASFNEEKQPLNCSSRSHLAFTPFNYSSAVEIFHVIFSYLARNVYFRILLLFFAYTHSFIMKSSGRTHEKKVGKLRKIESVVCGDGWK